jgi:hypothetical protein
MPSSQTLEQFIACVERGEHDTAIATFYALNASMRENQQVPRTGRDQLVEHERRVLARARSVQSLCVRPVCVAGDHVVIRWIFDFEWNDGRRTRMEELAWQRWEGECIAEEEFFYDPAQLIAKEAA